MPTIALRVGGIYRCMNKPRKRRIEKILYVNGVWQITYIECAFTEKNGWYTIGETKTCTKATFCVWLSSEVKEVKTNESSN